MKTQGLTILSNRESDALSVIAGTAARASRLSDQTLIVTASCDSTGALKDASAATAFATLATNSDINARLVFEAEL